MILEPTDPGQGGGGRDACSGLLCAAGGADWPLATYPCPFLQPSPSGGGGAHRPLTPACPPSPSAWPIPTSPHTPFHSLGRRVPTEPQHRPYFTALCRVHTRGDGRWAKWCAAFAHMSRCRVCSQSTRDAAHARRAHLRTEVIAATWRFAV